jgi:predicted nuclease of predicted toxin-antitoxin system
MTRILVGMNLSTEWIPLLRAAGHDAVFTHDLDFGSMLALSGADGPSVVQLRCLNVLPEAIGPLVLSLLKSYGSDIEQGALVVADERRQRVRILPLNRQA